MKKKTCNRMLQSFDPLLYFFQPYKVNFFSMPARFCFLSLLIAVFLNTTCQASALFSFPHNSSSVLSLSSPLALSAIAICIFLILIWALCVIRRLLRENNQAWTQLRQIETGFHELETIVTAEPGVLMVWKGRDTLPQQVLGEVKLVASVPKTASELLHFSKWLSPFSARELEQELVHMRLRGRPFNLTLRTIRGESLEADGRTAGGLATLRLRPLNGERHQAAELFEENRIVLQEVSYLSSMLNAAPFLIWLEGKKERELVWANAIFLQSTESPSLEAACSENVHLSIPLEGWEEKQARVCSLVIKGQKRSLLVTKTSISTLTAFFAVDITEKEIIKKDLDRHLRAQASLLDKLATAIAVFGADQRLCFYNSAYAELWGLPPAWLDTKPADGEILDRLREMRKIPEQENYKAWKHKYLTTYNALESRENWWHLPDGQSLRVISEPHPFGGLTYLYENVTEVIRLESRFTELINVQRETVDNLYEGVALFGTDGRLKLSNPSFCRLWSLEEEKLTQDPHIEDVATLCTPLCTEDTLWREAKRLVTSLDEQRLPFQRRVSRSDGMVFECAVVPLPDGNTLMTFVDVTASSGIERALRERNDALEAADRMKTNFLSNISYELRTPLTNIIGFSEGLALGIAGEMAPKQKEYLRDIQTSSSDLLSIIDAILDLTTIDAGAMELEYSEIDIPILLQSAAEAASQWLERRDLTLRIEVAQDLPLLWGDVKRMRQVLSHLLSNAIGFSEVGASVRMGARLDHGNVVIWVSDTGRGIDTEYQKQVFQRFQARPTAGGHRGPGLGLSLVKSFVELHGGTVSLISRVGTGTTVVCRLPLRNQETWPQDEARSA